MLLMPALAVGNTEIEEESLFSKRTTWESANTILGENKLEVTPEVKSKITPEVTPKIVVGESEHAGLLEAEDPAEKTSGMEMQETPATESLDAETQEMPAPESPNAETPTPKRERGLHNDTAFVADFYVEAIRDGTAPFDTSNNASDPYYKNRTGNDENDENGRVRSFDTITYDIHYLMNAYNPSSQPTQATMEFEFVLPLGKDEAEWDTEAMSWFDPGSVTITESNREFDFDGDGNTEVILCQVLKGRKTFIATEENPSVIPGSGTLQGVISVWGMANESIVQPVFTAWMEGNKTGDTMLWNTAATGNVVPCATHNRIEQISALADPVKVSAEPRYNVQIKATATSYYVKDTYDFNEGNALAVDMGAGQVNGMSTAYGITLQLYNHANRGLKGIELPQGDITFDLELGTTFVAAKPEEALNATQQLEVGRNYAPLVLSYDEHRGWGGQQDGRNLRENETYAVHAAPGNSGMVSASSAGSVNCYNGGTWRAQRDTLNTDVVTFTLSDYEINPRLFPNADLGHAPTAGIYFNPSAGVENVGSFSAGEVFIVTPFYNNGTTNSSKKDVYVLDDFGIDDGNFYTTIKGINLRATSISNQSLTEVSDNSNQANTNDDAVTSTIYLARVGGFDWRVAWSNYEIFMWDWTFRDVLGRTDSGGDWVTNGLDTVTAGVPVAIGLGFHNVEDGYIDNRAVAANVLNKFDADAVRLTGNTREVNINDYGLKYQILYGVKPNGQNWVNDTEMNNARIEDLRYYANISDIPIGSKCVAVLAEIRPSGSLEDVKKFNTGGIPMIQVEGITSQEESAVGKVFPMVIGGEIWRRHDYEISGTTINIPTMLGNNPASPTTVPNSTIYDYRTYVRVTYYPDGSTTGHTGLQNYGDSLRIMDVTSRITKQVAQIEVGDNKVVYQMDNDQRYADFILTPSFNPMPPGVSKQTNVTIVDTLPPNLRYVTNSSRIGGEYQQHAQSGRPGTVTGGLEVEPTVGTVLIGGVPHTTLTWVLLDVNSDDTLPVIHFTTEIGIKGDEENDVSHNELLTNEVVIYTTGDLRAFSESTGNKASVAIRISKLLSTSLSKLSGSWYDIYDYMDYRITVGNNATNTLNNAVIMDTMPVSGDEKGSDFTGEIFIRKFEIDTEYMTNITNWECYYTTSQAAVDTISDDYNANDIKSGTSSVAGGTVTWTKATIGADLKVADILNKPNITGIVFIGDLLGNQTFKANMELHAPESKANEVFVNGLSRGREISHALTRVVDRRISGLPWLDVNEDGLRRGENEVTISGIKIQLLEKNTAGNYVPFLDDEGNPIFVETSTTENVTTFKVETTNNKGETLLTDIIATARADGSYLFTGLPSGDYGIRFESGSTSLAIFEASPVGVGAEHYIDSDGVPTYEDGILKYTTIENIEMPLVEDMLSGVYSSEFNDSGFFYKDGSITLIKKGDNGGVLAGVEFSLEKKDSSGNWQSVTTLANTTDENGKLVYVGLLFGEYRITEISTIEGHTLLAEPLLVTLPYIVDAGTPGMSEPDYTEDGKDFYLHLTYTIENGRTYITPSTGGFGDSPYLIVGGLLVALAVNLWLAQKRKCIYKAKGRHIRNLKQQ